MGLWLQFKHARCVPLIHNCGPDTLKC